MRAFCIVFSSLALVASAASAETCEEQVTAFAETHGFDASPPEPQNMGATEPAPPATLESRGIAAEPLAKSGGVGEPVDESTKEAAGIPSADEVGSATPEADRERDPPPSPGVAEADGDRRLRAENLLLGAMSAAREGREKECLTLLQEAKEAI